MPLPTPNAGRWHVQRVSSTGSTNADLLDQARAGAPDGTVLVADHQTAGRGRLGRSWEAPAGSSLLASVLIRPTMEMADLHLLTQWVALAAVDACTEVAGVTPELKWPNDLMVEGRKLAGILAESLVTESRASAVAIGIGLNVTSAPPEAVALTQLCDRPVTVDAVLDGLLRALGDGPDSAVIRTAYRQRLSTLGQRVRVQLADGQFEGLAQAVGDDGRLEVVTLNGESRWVSAGDVVHLRPADPPD